MLEKSGGGDQSPVGFVASYLGQGFDAVCSNFIGRMRPVPGHDAGYLAHLFAALYEQGHTVPFIKQTTGIQNLDVGAFMAGSWVVPNRGEQQRRCALLDGELEQTSRGVELLVHQVELLAEKREALIIAAVTGELAIPGVAA